MIGLARAARLRERAHPAPLVHSIHSMRLHASSSPEQLLLYRLGPPRSALEDHRRRRYVAVCPHGETLLSVHEDSDELALARMRAELPRNPLHCDERTLWDAARAARLRTAAPGELQRYELAVQSAQDDLDMLVCRVPLRRFSDFVTHSSVISGERVWEDPRLAKRFFRVTATTVRGRATRFSLFVRGGREPAVVLRAPEETAIEGRPKFFVRFDTPTSWTGDLLRRAFQTGHIAVPGRGRDGRGVSATDLNLLSATLKALACWLVRRPPRAAVDNVTVEVEEHPASRLGNLATTLPA